MPSFFILRQPPPRYSCQDDGPPYRHEELYQTIVMQGNVLRRNFGTKCLLAQKLRQELLGHGPLDLEFLNMLTTSHGSEGGLFCRTGATRFWRTHLPLGISRVKYNNKACDPGWLVPP